MVLTRSKRKLLDENPPSPEHGSADRTISADNFSVEKIQGTPFTMFQLQSCLRIHVIFCTVVLLKFETKHLFQVESMFTNQGTP